MSHNSNCLLPKEAASLIKIIRPRFREFVEKFDDRKYPSRAYVELLKNLATPQNAESHIRSALAWKYGPTGKQTFPAVPEKLRFFQILWTSASPKQHSREFGGRNGSRPPPGQAVQRGSLANEDAFSILGRYRAALLHGGNIRCLEDGRSVVSSSDMQPR